MTDFEQQVARALINCPAFAPGTAVDYYVDLAHQIAPYVAAAIDVAVAAPWNISPTSPHRGRALAALRGEVVPRYEPRHS